MLELEGRELIATRRQMHLSCRDSPHSTINYITNSMRISTKELVPNNQGSQFSYGYLKYMSNIQLLPFHFNGFFGFHN